jgi:hypothetical protein
MLELHRGMFQATKSPPNQGVELDTKACATKTSVASHQGSPLASHLGAIDYRASPPRKGSPLSLHTKLSSLHSKLGGSTLEGHQDRCDLSRPNIQQQQMTHQDYKGTIAQTLNLSRPNIQQQQ